MGLSKTKESSTGASGQYWKVIQTDINWHRKVLICYLALFFDKASADAQKEYMESMSFTYSGTDFTFSSSTDVRSLIYAKIKSDTNNWLHDAVDVFEANQP